MFHSLRFLVALFFIGVCTTWTSKTMADSGHTVVEVKGNGATLHVETDGDPDAPALLLWNGAYCTTRMWDMVVPRLTEHYRVIRFDVRGTGLSSPSSLEEGYTMEQHADDAAAILDHLGVQQSLVWSMAWGSRAGIIYAARYPERVTLLALYDASVDAADVEAQRIGREEAFARQAEAGITPFERPEGWNFHKDQEASRLAIAAIRKFKDQQGQLGKITAPTLVCTGEHDPNIPSSRKIASRIKGAEFKLLEMVGHGSVLQRPDLTTDIFLEYAKRKEMLPE